MYTSAQLEAVGKSAAAHIGSRAAWIHRRVERITFPLPSDRVYRRNVSIDFTIPDLTPISENEQQRYYVPLSLLQRWPPLLRLDLCGPSGAPIPLLTSDQNAVVDAALLKAYAADVLDPHNLALDEDSEEAIATLAGVRRFSRHPRPSREVRSGALVSLIPPSSLGELTPIQKALRGDRMFAELAGALRDFTLLWLRVEGKPGDREVVKLAYDAALTARVRPWSRQAFGLLPTEVEFEAPHLGGSGSYHLSVSVPAPLNISDAAVVIDAPRTAEGFPDESRLVVACASKEGEVQEPGAEGFLDLYVKRTARDARFYVSGPRTGSTGKVRIAMFVQGTGLIRPGAIAGLAITALLLLVAFGLGSVLSNPDPGVTTLLVAPALLAYLIVRPSDHAIVAQLVGSLRRVLIVLGALPLAAAAALSVSTKWHLGLKVGLFALAAIALIMSAILVVSWLLPRSQRWRLRFSG